MPQKYFLFNDQTTSKLKNKSSQGPSHKRPNFARKFKSSSASIKNISMKRKTLKAGFCLSSKSSKTKYNNGNENLTNWTIKFPHSSITILSGFQLWLSSAIIIKFSFKGLNTSWKYKRTKSTNLKDKTLSFNIKLIPSRSTPNKESGFWTIQ